jgi:hypothetical protein
MLIWINDNQIAGTSDFPVEPSDRPQGFNLVEYDGDRVLDQLYWDGSKVCEKPERPTDTAFWNLSEQTWQEVKIVKDNQPSWTRLTATFQMPGNPLYNAVLEKIAHAGFTTQDHWSNFKLLLSTPALQSTESLAASIAHLDRLLSDAGHGLSNQDKASWNRLMEECNFPIECQLR